MLTAIPQFNAIGSDPEFLFVTTKEFRPQVIPANSVITANKVLALKSFIGTDNHATTAEMRPGPAHNVGRHLYDIAYGLHETDKWLAKHKLYNNIKIVAQPFVGEEPLGGHIHCSMFVDEPETKAVLAINRVYKNDRIVVFDETQQLPSLREQDTALLNQYTVRLHNQELFTAVEFAKAMDHLLWPFECAIQPWWDRQRRNGRYGGTLGIGERVRQNVSYSKSNKVSKFAYLHYEYRVPSTWLCHPWLAYSYLGLAKLAMLNLKSISAVKTKELIQLKSGEPGNDVHRAIFDKRFNEIKKSGKWSNDLKGLIEIIPQAFNKRSDWFEIPGQPIDIDAWRRLL